MTFIYKKLPRLLGRLPIRFRWTLHNVVAHPAMELLHLVNKPEYGDVIHDATIPNEWA